MITVNLTYNLEGPTDPENPDFDTLNTEELMYDAAYYAKNAKNAAGNQVAEGDPVITIPDKKGTKHMYYEGDATPAVIGSAPKFMKGGIWAENVPFLQYTSDDYPLKSFPFEMTLVTIDHPCQAYEAKTNSYNSDTYYGNNGSNSRAGDNDMIISGSTINPLFKVSISHIKFEAALASLWIDGVFQGSVSRTSRSSRKTCTAIFTDTNNQAYMLLAMYEKYSAFSSDTVRQNVLSSLATKWAQGTEIQEPYAYNIAESYNSTTQIWSVTYSGKNLSGTGIDSAATEYKWYLNKRAIGQGDFGDQTLVGTSATLPRSAYASLVSGFTGDYYIKCYIKVKDSTGKAHGFTSSPGYAEE